MRVLLFCFLAVLCYGLPTYAQTLTSPDGRLEIAYTPASRATFSGSLAGRQLFTLAAGLEIDGKALPRGTGRPGPATTVDDTVRPVVATKRTAIRDHYRAVSIAYPNGVTLELRAYDNGFAYRYTGLPAGRLDREIFDLALPDDTRLFYPAEDGFYSHNERTYLHATPDSLAGRLASLPVLAGYPDGAKLWLSETDLYDYPGLWMEAKKSGLTGRHPALPRNIADKTNRDEILTRADHLADLAAGSRTPWRILAVAATDAELLDVQLTDLLATPPSGDFSWVRPGQVAWDWYNANLLTGVDFVSGFNTKTYEYYIDFAARNHIPYVILDEGWSPTTNVLEQVPEIDVEYLADYAEAKGVGLILWVLWKPFVKDLEKVCARYADWGIRGVKVDFLQRDDQVMVNNYREMARVAAEHELLVDFHGSYKPAGLHRTYPNVITREGLKGLEWYKFGNPGSLVGPDHDCTLPFIRMVAGPIDFTPGAMANAQREHHAYNFEHPTSLGTRTHQLAMYVVYESPLQMLADSPTAYEAEMESTDFIVGVPTVWAETVPLAGKVGDYVAVARRAHCGDWFIGAINDWTARDLEIDLDFLPPGRYQLELFRDGPNHTRDAEDYVHETIGVTAGQKLTLPLGRGGGWVGRLRAR